MLQGAIIKNNRPAGKIDPIGKVEQNYDIKQDQRG
jgi:hypothetical protein